MKDEFDWDRVNAVIKNKPSDGPAPVRLDANTRIDIGLSPDTDIMLDEFGIWFGSDIASEGKEKIEIIEKFLHSDDIAFLVAPKKLGKTIFGTQVAAALSTGQDLLDTLSIPKKKKVFYLQLEGSRSMVSGKLTNFHKRKMADLNNIVHVNEPGMPLNTTEGLERLHKILRAIEQSWGRPDVMILDSAYMSVHGSMCSDDVITQWCNNIKNIVGSYGMSCIVIHHPTKQNYSANGTKVDKGDDMHGSGFLGNFGDHILRLQKKGQKIICTCETDRSGNILQKIETKFNKKTIMFEPLTSVVEQETSMTILKAFFKKNKGEDLHLSDIEDESGVSHAQIHRILKELLKEGYITKPQRGYYRFDA